MTIVWEEAWQALNEAFVQLAADLVNECPNLTWSCGHHENDAFPFRAYAGFSNRGIREEDVVVSVDFCLHEGGMRYDADVTLADGQILVEGPAGDIVKSVDTVNYRSEILTAISRVAQFVLSCKPAIIDGLKNVSSS